MSTTPAPSCQTRPLESLNLRKVGHSWELPLVSAALLDWLCQRRLSALWCLAARGLLSELG